MSTTFVYPATLDVDTALDLLEQAVRDRGYDFKMDSQCFYVLDGAPRCLVGLALYKAGVNVDRVLGGQGTNGCRIGATIDGSLSAAEQALRDAGVVLTDDTREVLAAAQDAQDAYKTWGEALVRATQARLVQVKRTYAPPF